MNALYYSENRVCGQRVGTLQALMIFLDEKVRKTRLFANVITGHYTSSWSIKKSADLMSDEILDDIDTDMSTGGGSGKLAIVSY